MFSDIQSWSPALARSTVSSQMVTLSWSFGTLANSASIALLASPTWRCNETLSTEDVATDPNQIPVASIAASTAPTMAESRTGQRSRKDEMTLRTPDMRYEE